MSKNQIIPTTGKNNCGGRCLLYAHVQDGKVVKMTTETAKDCPGRPPLSACMRGLNYHKTFLGVDRLRYPMKRTGMRGEGKFTRITWEEAVDIITREWIRIRDKYGPGSRYVNYATGVSAAISPSGLAKRLLSLDGGFLDSYNNYSNACAAHATNLMYGTTLSGSSSATLLDSQFILLMGHNPAETHFGSEIMYYLKKAKECKIPIVAVDPRKSDTIKTLNAQWIPIRPATDSALLDALCYRIWREGLADQSFLDRYCIGFDEDHMPEDTEPGQSVLAYLTGEKDGIVKDETWAEQITGIPSKTIRELAIRFGKAKPAALVQGYGLQRHAYGEQSIRGGILLAAMTGNIGVSGGSAAGVSYIKGHVEPKMPSIINPYRASIPAFRWTDAVKAGTLMGKAQGVIGMERLQSDIKMILNLAGNTLINQHSDINKTTALLRDTSKCEFIVCSDLFMTPSAKYADILLPGVSLFEEENLNGPWHEGDFIGFNNQVMEPLYECQSEYTWLTQIAQKLGVKAEFTQGRTQGQWLEYILNECRKQEPDIPDIDTIKQLGIWHFPKKKPAIAFEEQIKDPINHPFPTGSGKIELYSAVVSEMAFEDPFPPIPCYVAPPEGYQDSLRETYPLQLIGWHTKRRCHSIHDNNPELVKKDPQRLILNSIDAKKRGIVTGDSVLIYNDRGKVTAPAFVTEDIMPGVASLAQGAWYTPDENGVDMNGSINVLTSLHPTPLARGNPQHTNLVEIEKI